MYSRHTHATQRLSRDGQIRADLGDELDRAKRRWMKSAARTGEDNHMHGQWRELKVTAT